MKFRDLSQPMNLETVKRALGVTLYGDPYSEDVRAELFRLIEVIRCSPGDAYVVQGKDVGRRGADGGIDVDSFWWGFSHGLTLAAASGDPAFAEAIRTQQLELKKGTHSK